VLACARGGYSQGPALGKLLAELMLEGTTSLPVDKFDPGRFRA
jgi:sarcosine oxidase subunit beta